MNECEHCGKSKEEPIIIEGEGERRTFCTPECVMESEMSGSAGLWRSLESKKVAARRAIERLRGSKVITLIHRMELHNGTDQFITMEDSEEILNEILSVSDGKPIDIIVHCPGGVALSAEQIALAIKNYQGKVTAIVPYYAMSGASLISLSADEILMDPHSVLGPLDPQISNFPSPSLLRLTERKPPQFISDEMMILADLAEKALSQMKGFIVTQTEDNIGRDNATKLAEFLTGGYLTHDSPITVTELLPFGLKVKQGIPPEVYQFMALHRLVSQVGTAFGGGLAGQGHRADREDKRGGSPADQAVRLTNRG